MFPTLILSCSMCRKTPPCNLIGWDVDAMTKSLRYAKVSWCWASHFLSNYDYLVPGSFYIPGKKSLAVYWCRNGDLREWWYGAGWVDIVRFRCTSTALRTTIHVALVEWWQKKACPMYACLWCQEEYGHPDWIICSLERSHSNGIVWSNRIEFHSGSTPLVY